jgi:hypothetical protein
MVALAPLIICHCLIFLAALTGCAHAQRLTAHVNGQIHRTAVNSSAWAGMSVSGRGNRPETRVPATGAHV